MSRQNLPSVALRTLYSFSFSLRERQKKAHEKRSVQRDFKKEEIRGLVPGFRFFINDATVYCVYDSNSQLSLSSNGNIKEIMARCILSTVYFYFHMNHNTNTKTALLLGQNLYVDKQK